MTARQTPIVGVFILLSIVGVATAAAASELPTGCPANPSACTFASATIQVGPLTANIEASAENGSAELEENVRIAPGEAGTIMIGVSANSSAQNATYNVTFQANETEGILWNGANDASFAYTPSPGVSEVRTFRFRVDPKAEGLLPIPLTIQVDDAVATLYVTFTVTQENVEDNPTPVPGVLAAVGALGLVALARRRER